MQQKEVWKPIKGYEGLYEISNIGRVRNVRTNKILKSHQNRNGYERILLSKSNTTKRHSIHRLIYQAFIGDIPCGYVVHHIDHNPNNNDIGNLQLMPRFEHNSMHKKGNVIPFEYSQSEEAIEKRKKKISKPTAQMSLDGEIMAVYPSTIEASRQTGVDQSNIWRCCNGKMRSAGGFHWKYI